MAAFRSVTAAIVACLPVIAAALITVALPRDGWCAPYDGRPKLLLHVAEPTSKNACSPGLLATGADAVVSGDLIGAAGPAFVYVLAAGATNVDTVGMAGAEFGISFGGGLTVFSWTKCAALEFPMPGWPSSGTGNLIVWMALSSDGQLGCQYNDTSVLGYFYVGAYAADYLGLTVRPVSGTAKVANCSSAETLLGLHELGFVAFSAGAVTAGCNPYLGPCGSPPAPDTTPPGAVTDLAVTAVSDSSVTLSWTAPGDDAATGTAAAYDLRYSTEPLTAGNFAAADALPAPTPAVAGTNEEWTVHGLDAETSYFFALKAGDEVPNWSTLSNVATGTTAAPPDTVPPAAIADLDVAARSDTSITLSFTAPGDDGSVGTATSYEVRYATAPLTPANFDSATLVAGVGAPDSAGTPQSIMVGGLSPATDYSLAVRTVDDAGNWSDVSNVVTETTTESPSPLFSQLPPVFVLTPSGAVESQVYVQSLLGPLSGVVVTLTIDAGVDTLVRWASGQGHPVVTAMTDALGVARFFLAGGMPPMSPGAVSVSADGVELGSRHLVSPDIVNDLGQTIDNPCLVRCGELEVNGWDLEFHARNLGTTDWRSDFDGNGVVGAADTAFVSSLAGDSGPPAVEWFSCTAVGVSGEVYSGAPHDSTFMGVFEGEAYLFLDTTVSVGEYGIGVINTGLEARDLLYRFTDLPPDFDLAPHETEGCLRIEPRTLEYIPPPYFWELPQLTLMDSLRLGLDVWVHDEDGLWTLDRARVTILVNGWDIDRCPKVTILQPTGEHWVSVDEVVEVICSVEGALVLYPVVLSRLSVSRLGPDGEPTTWEVVDEDLDARESPVNSITAVVDSLDGVRLHWTPPVGLPPGGYALVVEITDSRGCVSRDTVRVAVPISEADPPELEVEAPESAPTGGDAEVSASTTGMGGPTRVVGVSRKRVTGGKVVHNVAELDQHELAAEHIKEEATRDWGCGPTSLTSIIMAMALCDSGLVKDSMGNVRSPDDIAEELYLMCDVRVNFGTPYSRLRAAIEKFWKSHSTNPMCKYGFHGQSKDKLENEGDPLSWNLLHQLSILPDHFTILRVGNHYVVVDSIGTDQNAVPRQVRIMDPESGRKVIATFEGHPVNSLSWMLEDGSTYSGRLRTVLGIRQSCRKPMPPSPSDISARSASGELTSGYPFPGLPDYPPVDHLFPPGWDPVLVDSMPGAQPHVVAVPVPPEAGPGDALLIHVALVDSAWAWYDTVLVVPIVVDPSGVGPPDPAGLESILHQNFPNPFRGSTVFPVLIRESGQVTLSVHSVDGRLVRKLVDAALDAGTHLVEWDGRDQLGHFCPAGLYFVRLSAGGVQAVRRVALLK